MVDPETPQPTDRQFNHGLLPGAGLQRDEAASGRMAAGASVGDATGGDATVISQPPDRSPNVAAAKLAEPAAGAPSQQPAHRPAAAAPAVPAGIAPAATGRATLGRRSVAELAHALTGRQLEHFLLEELIGGGGMGAVFRGRDVRLDRIVAVKVMPAADRNLESYRRFRIEAQSAARLDHPHIARVYYIGESEDWNYIVFEFIEGVNLRDWVLRVGPLEVDDALCITRQIADALQHAFDRHVVHRDIKPSNILLTPTGVAKLVDMGLARTVQLDRSAEDVTLSGVTLGTFDYIAPEQARDPRQADVRSDLYSLGCTLYFLLTASPPFSEAQGLQKLLSHSQRPAPDPRLYRGDLPDDLVGILGKLMAKRPADRYAKPLELVADIQRLADSYGLTKTQAVGVIEVASMPPAQRSLFETLLPWACMLALLLISTFWLQNLDRLDRGINLSRPQMEVTGSLPTVSPVSSDGGAGEPARPRGAEASSARSALDSAAAPAAGAESGSGAAAGLWGPPALSQPVGPEGEAADVGTAGPDRLQSWLDRLTGRAGRGAQGPTADEVSGAGGLVGGGGVLEVGPDAAASVEGRPSTAPADRGGGLAIGAGAAPVRSGGDEPLEAAAADASGVAYSRPTAPPQVVPRAVWLLGESSTALPADALLASNWQQALLLVDRVQTIQRLVIGVPRVRCESLKLPRSGLTIEAAPGMRSTLSVAFESDGTSDAVADWLDIGESSLRMQRLDIEVSISGTGWRGPPSLFRIGTGGRLYLGQCVVSVRDDRGEGERAAVVAVGTSSAPRSLSEGVQRLDDFPFDLQIQDSVIRGAVDLLVASSIELAGRVQWDNGLLAIDGWMVRLPPELAIGAEFDEETTQSHSPLMHLDLHQLTLHCRAGWASLPLERAAQARPWLMREATRCRFQVGPGRALVRLQGQPTSDTQWLATRVTFRGGENVYFLDEGRLVGWAEGDSAERLAVGPMPDPGWLVAEDWAAQFVPAPVGLEALPLHRVTPADYRWSGEGTIGHQLSRLPPVAAAEPAGT